MEGKKSSRAIVAIVASEADPTKDDILPNVMASAQRYVGISKMIVR